MTALPNPSDIEYQWSQGTSPGVAVPRSLDPRSLGSEGDREMKSLNEARSVRLYSQGGVLKLAKVERGDSGYYTIKATNAEGATETRVMINVQYPPR